MSAPFLLAAAILASPASSDPASALEQKIAEAEARLQEGAFPAAEARYREALFEGYVLKATLDALDGRTEAARDALADASLFRMDTKEGLVSLATLELQAGDSARALEILADAAARPPRDAQSLRLLARARAAAGQLDAAADALRDASAAAGDDPEALFLVATEYLWLKKPEEAERLFARVAAARPIPQTRVLIGRSYRDAGEYARAEAELRAALAQDPGVRRAHYYLAMCWLADATTSPERRESAILELREELKLDPRDPLASDQLGVALLDSGRPEEALPALQTAVREDPRARHLQHLGRALLALDRPAEAADASRRALERGATEGDADLEKVHYQLGLALRKLGKTEEAAAQLAKAREVAARAAETARPRGPAFGSLEETSPLAGLPPPQREELRHRVRGVLVRACFNLGVLQTQGPSRATTGERFARAAAFLERAAALDPDFPGVQGSWGVACFNARQFDKATGPLARAVSANPNDVGLRRMLALAYINTLDYDKAVPLLEKDPQREGDTSLQSAYGMSLLRSGRAGEAEKVLAGLVETRGESAELLVLLGQAQAEQKKWDKALVSLHRALELDAKAADAAATIARIEAARRRKASQ